MIFSVITINNWFFDTEEMLIPVKIGDIKQGFITAFRNLRLLTIGGRYRGDVRI
ncbi:MAG: hypothetical protein Q8936_01900 [Bacillota bacterium]|nr:hypothetical protein [Bacillota bacterium]